MRDAFTGLRVGATPEGAPGDPGDYLLTLHVAKEPSGVVKQVMTWTPVKFERETDAKYDTVSIVGVVSGIEVKEVS